MFLSYILYETEVHQQKHTSRSYQRIVSTSVVIIQLSKLEKDSSLEVEYCWAPPDPALWIFSHLPCHEIDAEIVQPTLHKIPEEFGCSGYIGMLEIFHLLHCLDEIKKATYA